MQALKKSYNLYLLFIAVVGIGTFLKFTQVQLDPNGQTVTIFALVGSILLLNHYRIIIPPNGNCISMDSAIFLASIFLFGLDLTLNILFLYTVIYWVYQWKVEWWKHVFNFSTYSIMIILADFSFIFTGGQVGSIDTSNLFPYIVSMTVYFLLNTILISIYFLLAERDGLKNLLSELMKDKTFMVSYFNIFLLSFVVAILLDSVGLFGLFLFVSIAMLLSIAFIQHFEQYQEVSNKANKDYLTGLNNHGYFKEILETQITDAKETGQVLSLSLIDLDDFKKYNDVYGHIQGDKLLRDFGTLIEAQAQADDYTVARYGGEEFAILMPAADKNAALIFMDRLRKLVNDTHFDGVEALPYGCLSFSAGIAQLEKGTYNSAEILTKADQAMYHAKSLGKNLVEIYNEQTEYLTEDSQTFAKQLEEAEQQLKIFLSKDVYTYRHSKRVFQYAVDFGRKLNLSEHERKVLTLGALVHDIGKLEVPRDIINKKGKLEPIEWEIMKKHVIFGKEIISTNKQLEELIPLVELHHERLDGKGYPHGLKGDNIPKLARILCIIDSFDAMTTERPYQKTKTFEEAIRELRECSGKQFDPAYVEPFIQLIQQNHKFTKIG
ncbi:bifunctional diguanylate cyclase/phosphohydrolase [Mesobacillus harenae]|uniref:bifunctional diguanylate cyclase/phosphohydrolase n=1 Tax=Mesobacillus harenae TaxID=2213203 RepID=UPI00157FDE1C|nr:diguanylate cyclase [Mesobacillus harenae]